LPPTYNVPTYDTTIGAFVYPEDRRLTPGQLSTITWGKILLGGISTGLGIGSLIVGQMVDDPAAQSATLQALGVTSATTTILSLAGTKLIDVMKGSNAQHAALRRQQEREMLETGSVPVELQAPSEPLPSQTFPGVGAQPLIPRVVTPFPMDDMPQSASTLAPQPPDL
jgi:hypothetical protein